MEWTEEAISRLRTLWAEGHSTKEIGRRLGLSKNAVVGKAHRLDLPPRPSPIRRGPDATSGASQRRVLTEARRRMRATGQTLPVLASVEAPAPTPATSPFSQSGEDQSGDGVRQPGEPEIADGRTVALSADLLGVPPGEEQASAPPPVLPAGAFPSGPAASRPSARTIPCCWPIGEPGTSSFHFCEADAVPGKPYCEPHVQIAYVPIRDRREDGA